MWVKKSFISLSASVVSALYAKNYTTACIFFVMSVFERMEENEEEERRKHEEERRKTDSNEIFYLEQRILRRLGGHDCDISDLESAINLLRENL